MGWFDSLRAGLTSPSVRGGDSRDYPPNPPVYEQIFYDSDAITVLPISNGYLLRIIEGREHLGEMTRNRIIYAKTEEEIVQQLISNRARRAMGDPGTTAKAMAAPINKQRNKI